MKRKTTNLGLNIHKILLSKYKYQLTNPALYNFIRISPTFYHPFQRIKAARPRPCTTILQHLYTIGKKRKKRKEGRRKKKQPLLPHERYFKCRGWKIIPFLTRGSTYATRQLIIIMKFTPPC